MRILISDIENELGRKLAADFADWGFDVYALACNKTTEKLPGVAYLPYDPSKEADMEELIGFMAAIGNWDALVVSPRRMQAMDILSEDERRFQALFDHHVKTAFLLTKHVGRYFAKQSRGSVIYIGSFHDEKPTGASLPFSCSMGAIKMLHREAAIQMAGQGNSYILLEVGPMKQDIEKMRGTLSPLYDHTKDCIPRQELIGGGEISQAVKKLIGDSSLNGSEIRVDAGFLLHYEVRK